MLEPGVLQPRHSSPASQSPRQAVGSRDQPPERAAPTARVVHGDHKITCTLQCIAEKLEHCSGRYRTQGSFRPSCRNVGPVMASAHCGRQPRTLQPHLDVGACTEGIRSRVAPPDWATTPCIIASPRPVPLPGPLVDEKWFGRAGQCRRVHARSGIRNLKHNVLPGRQLGRRITTGFPVRYCDGQCSTVRHRVTCIDRQIEDNEFHLVWIDERRPQCAVRFDYQPHILAQGTGAAIPAFPRPAVADRQTAVAGPVCARTPTVVASKQPHYRPLSAHSATASCHRIQDVAFGHADIADDHCEQIVEIMRDAAGQLPQALHLLALIKLFLCPLRAVGLRPAIGQRHDVLVVPAATQIPAPSRYPPSRRWPPARRARHPDTRSQEWPAGRGPK